jgi:hypothetical protein
MAHWERDVQSLLRPSERLLLTLEGSYLPHGWETDSEASPPGMGSPPEEARVILAIVEHVNRAMGESGRLILDAFALSFYAKHPLKCVPLHRGRGSIKGCPWLPSLPPTHIHNSCGIFP